MWCSVFSFCYMLWCSSSILPLTSQVASDCVHFISNFFVIYGPCLIHSCPCPGHFSDAALMSIGVACVFRLWFLRLHSQWVGFLGCVVGPCFFCFTESFYNYIKNSDYNCFSILFLLSNKVFSFIYTSSSPFVPLRLPVYPTLLVILSWGRLRQLPRLTGDLLVHCSGSVCLCLHYAPASQPISPLCPCPFCCFTCELSQPAEGSSLHFLNSCM